MKSVWSLVIVAGSILAAAAFQLTPDDELARRFIQTTTGTVKSYSADEQIVIVGDDGAEVAMELDAGARVDDSLAAGQTVTIAWLIDSLGRRRVTSIAPSSPVPQEGGSASSAPPSKAYASSTEGTAMSSTPSGPMASTPEPPLSGTPRARVTGTAGYTTPGMGARTMPPGTGATPGSPQTTPGPPAPRTPGTGSN
jgi:hypothetical protein